MRFPDGRERGGSRDWWPLRIACVLLPLPLLLYPRIGRLSLQQIAYYEFVGWAVLPVGQTFLMLLNRPDSYWSSSIMLVGMFLGLLTRPQLFPIHLVTGSAAGIGLYALVMGPPDPESLRQLWGFLANAAMAGALALGIQTGLHAFHRRGVQLAEATARSLESQRREAEVTAAYTELKRREQVITRFVRPSLFDELAQGHDPVDFEPVEKELAVLFCDIRDFTSLTEVLGPRDKQGFLNRYFAMITRPIVEQGGEVDKIMGDCVMGIFPDGRKAVRAAVEIRLSLQEFNRGMLAEGKPKIRNGIGIAKGPVMLGNFGSHEKLDRTVIGEAVNIASRLESKTKLYDLEVVVTEEVIRDLDPLDAHSRWIDNVRLKGSSRGMRIYEVYSHQPPAVRGYKDGTRGRMEKGLDIYFRKGFKDAMRIFQAMQAEVPAHLHQPGFPMDNLLAYYIDRCQGWIRDDEAWERSRKWEGVHVFLEK